MRLRSIELRGFKSFAETVKLPLDARLIGIVGPNGCGKSNIADALRWIMGEQKGRLLRIDRSDNLIFNGSQHRKPLPFAEVTLEVEDFSPELPRLTFTRRVYRTGESEYFLNGASARLKDFLQYFWQVGLSPQGILDGGQVEALIQDRSGARRALIESLAGIERYHHHKKEILAELEKTETALTQVESILVELRQQIKQLSAQAQKVTTYQNLKSSYQDLLAKWIAQELAILAKTEAQQAKEMQTHAGELSALQIELEQLELRLQALEEKEGEVEIRALEGTVSTLRAEMSSLLQTESRLRERTQQLERQSADTTEEKSLRLRQKAELTEEEHTLRQKREEAEKNLLEKRNGLAEISAQLRQLESTLREKELAFQQKSKDRQQKEAAYIRILRQKEEAEAALRPLSDHLASLEKELQAGEERHIHLLQEKEQREAQIRTLQAELEEAQHQLAALITQRDSLQKEQDSILRKLREVEGHLHALQMQKKTLEALLARSEGWPSYLKELRAQGVAFWRTEDIFFADEEKLARLSLLLRLLPPTLWVCEPSEAEKIRSFLADKKEGFFAVRIYSSQKGRYTNTWLDQLQTLEGFEGLAGYLWGHLVEGEGDSIFSSDGRQLRLPDGWVYLLAEASTHHIGLPHRIRQTEKELEEVEQNLTSLREQLSEIEKALKELPIQIHQRKVDELKHALNAAERDLSVLKARIEEVENRHTALRSEKERLREKQSALSAKLETFSLSLEELQSQLTALQGEEKALEAEVIELRRQYSSTQKAQDSLRFSYLQVENGLKQVENAHKLILRQLDEVQKRLFMLTDKEGTLLHQLEQAKAELEACIRRKAEIEPKLREAEKQLSTLLEQKKQREEMARQLRQRLTQLQQRKETLQNALWRSENRQSELAQRRSLLLQRLAVELELTPAELPPPPSTRLKAEEVEARLSQIKGQIAQLGELNFEAASALQSLLQREAEILREKTDIERTLSRLKSLLSSLDKEAQEKFLTAFEAVRRRFIQLFQLLFAEGDTCDLILSQPESPLTSEIEIIARPKGKRPLSLQQLSGGEKALTVLALLFATFAVRPSALCVLDEVDAPLDDANAHKFGRLLQKIAEETPILVITHNKITMSYCERLYGVTMPEAGVSTVLAVEMQAPRALAEAV